MRSFLDSLRRPAVKITLAVLLGLAGAHHALVMGLTPPDSSERAVADCDIVMLRRGMQQAPTLRDTLRWWTGEWIGCNPFWRPLSSYAFWLTVRTIGLDHQDEITLVMVGCHVVVAVLLLLLIEAMTGRPLLGLLAVFLHNIGGLVVIPLKLFASPGMGSVAHWIYAPDLWLAMSVLPALMLAWRGSIWGAALLATVAAMTKETGFVAFPLVMLFYWWPRRRFHRAFWAIIGIAVLLSAVRLIYVGPGWIMGSNRSMWHRMFRFVAPWPVNALVSSCAPGAVVGMGLGALVIWWRSGWKRWLIVGGTLVAAMLASFVLMWWADGHPPRPDVALAGAIDHAVVRRTTLQVAVWVIIAWAGLRGRDRSLVVLLALGHLVLGFPATIAPQTGQRSYYTAWLLSSGARAICVWSLPAALRSLTLTREAPSPDGAADVAATVRHDCTGPPRQPSIS